MMPRRVVTAFLCAVVGLAAPVASWAEDDPCSASGSVEEYLNTILADYGKAMSSQKEALDKTGAEAQEELCKRVASGGDGLGAGRADFFCRFFVALDLGEIEEKEESLVFNFSPEKLGLGGLGRFAPKVIVHEPSLYEPLAKDLSRLPESVREERKTALTDGLEDFDDVEVVLRWTNQRDPPRESMQALADEIFEPAFTEARANTPSLGEPLAQLAQLGNEAVKSRAKARGQDPDQVVVPDLTLEDFCAPVKAADFPTASAADILDLQIQAQELRDALRAAVVKLRGDAKAGMDALRSSLDERSFFSLADLYEGEGRMEFDGSYRDRSDQAGPDQWSVSASFVIGGLRIKDWEEWRQRHPEQSDGRGFNAMMAEHKQMASSLPTFSFKAKYEVVKDYEFLLNSDAFVFDQEGERSFSGMLTGGAYVGGTRRSRFDLEAGYDESRGLVGTLTYSQTLSESVAQLAGGTKLAISLVYADKPQFRGEVDEELSLRAGLKWSIGGKKETDQANGSS